MKLFALALMLVPAFAREPNVVVKITSTRTAEGMRIGTGVCMDTPCQHVLTAYHVVASIGKHMLVEGIPVRTITTDDARNVHSIQTGAGQVLRFDPGKDYALLTLDSALARFTGVDVARDVPQPGQSVRVLARHNNEVDAADGTITATGVDLQTLDGVAKVGGILISTRSRPGNSGGAVLDQDGRLLAIVEIETSDGHTLALPVGGFSKLPDALRVLDQEPRPSPGESAKSVTQLRARAHDMLSSMKPLLCDATLRFGKRVQRYRVSVFNERTVYRTIDDRKEVSELPIPASGAISLYQWYDLMRVVERVPFLYLGEATYLNHPVHVFRATLDRGDDSACRFRESPLGRKSYVACDTTVIADSNFKITRMIQDLYPPTAKTLRIDVEFGTVSLPNLAPVHLPVSIATIFEGFNGRMETSTVSMSNFHIFQSTSRIEFN